MIDRKAAKELLHIQVWLHRVDEILAKGEDAHFGGRRAAGKRLAAVTGAHDQLADGA